MQPQASSERAPTAGPAALPDPDLVELVAGRRLQVQRVVRITTLPSRLVSRETYRLHLTDGTSVKVRRVETAEQAYRVEALLRAVGLPELPCVLARRGSLLLEPWIEGTEPDLRDGAFVRSCGALLGSLHAMDAGQPEQLGPHAAIARELHQLRTDLDRAVARGLLSCDRATSLYCLMQAAAPRAATVGYVHGDFCGDNIVMRGDDKPVVVDNETMHIGAHDLDLARTWYRWPMAAWQRAEFIAGYETRRSLAGFARHFPFWIARVLARSVKFRLRTAGDVDEPLRLLLRLLDPRLTGPAAHVAWDARG